MTLKNLLNMGIEGTAEASRGDALLKNAWAFWNYPAIPAAFHQHFVTRSTDISHDLRNGVPIPL